jgi:hypothetical protein
MKLNYNNLKLYELYYFFLSCQHKIDRGSSSSRSVEISLWKRLWTCRQTTEWMNECQNKILSGWFLLVTCMLSDGIGVLPIVLDNLPMVILTTL